MRCPSCFTLLASACRAWLCIVELDVPLAGPRSGKMHVKVTTCGSHYCRAQAKRIARSA